MRNLSRIVAFSISMFCAGHAFCAQLSNLPNKASSGFCLNSTLGPIAISTSATFNGFTPNESVMIYGVNGTNAAPLACDINGNLSAGAILGVTIPSLATGYLYYNGSVLQWAASGGGSFTALTGDATSTSSGGATTVNGLKGIALPTLAASTGLLYDTAGVLSLAATLPTAAMPGFTGDVSKSAGSLATTVVGIQGSTLPTLAAGYLNYTGSAFQYTAQISIAAVGSAGLSGTSPITISTAGAIGCATCATTAGTVSTFSAGTTGFTPSSATSGAVTLGGTLAVANGGTGAATVGANTVFGNFTGSTAAPTFTSAPTFSATNLTNFPTFNQNTTGTAAGLSATLAIGSGGTNATSATAGSVPNATSGTAASWTATPTLGANGGTGGSLTLNGSTSGNATINTSATGVLALPSGTTVTSMSLTTPLLGTPTSGVITNLTGTCTSCVANSAGSVTNALTLNNSNSGAASGGTYNGSAAVTASANTFGAGSLANGNTWSAANIFSVAGAASTPSVDLTGAPYTGGSATTNYPLLYLNDGTAPTTWSGSGTEIGANAPTGFTGNFIDFHLNGGGSLFSVGSGGTTAIAGTLVPNGGTQANSGSFNLYIPSAAGAGHTAAAGYQFAGSSGMSFRSGIGVGTTSTTLTVGDNYAAQLISSAPITTPATGTNAWLVSLVAGTLGTVTSGGAAITNTASLYVGAASAAGTNNYAIYSAGLVSAASINTNGGRKGTFVCTAAGTITISNTNEIATSDVIISMNAQGGTITTPPAMKTVTGGTGFTVLCGASDTSTYNYNILN